MKSLKDPEEMKCNRRRFEEVPAKNFGSYLDNSVVINEDISSEARLSKKR